MSIRFIYSPCLVLLCVALALGSGLHGSNRLVENSPFIPEGWLEAQQRREQARDRQPPPKPEAPAIALERLLEFRGAFRLGGTWRFNIVNKKDNSSKWIGFNDKGSEVRVQSFNDQTQQLRVSFEGRTETLELTSPSDKVQAVATAANVVQKAAVAGSLTTNLNQARRNIEKSNASEEDKKKMLAQLEKVQRERTGQVPNVVASTNPGANGSGGGASLVVSGGGGGGGVPQIPTLTIGGQGSSPSNNANANNDGVQQDIPAARVQRRKVIRSQ